MSKEYTVSEEDYNLLQKTKSHLERRKKYKEIFQDLRNPFFSRTVRTIHNNKWKRGVRSQIQHEKYVVSIGRRGCVVFFLMRRRFSLKWMKLAIYATYYRKNREGVFRPKHSIRIANRRTVDDLIKVFKRWKKFLINDTIPPDEVPNENWEPCTIEEMKEWEKVYAEQEEKGLNPKPEI